MPAPAITASTRYFDPETTKVYYVASIANKAAPTRAELNAGTDLSREVADITGWNVTGEQIPTPDLGTLFTSQIPGRTTSDDSSLTFYADKAGVDARGTLPRGTNGFIVWLDGGDTANNKMDVYPIRVRSNGKMRSLSNEAARIQIQFSITSEPAENVTVPA